MAKRKAARTTGRKTAGKRAGARRSRSAGRKTTARRAGARKSAKKTRPAARKAARGGARKAARKVVARRARRQAPRRSKQAPRRSSGQATARKTAKPVTRKAPALNRARRTVQDEDLVPTPPSSLDLDRSASAVRTGRRELRERFDKHTETSPALTGGDVDADWESAYSVGDEAPGGDNPTPDQDIVDDIGRAVGVEYQDNEELKGEKKIIERDKHRWELDPASSEDYDDR